MRASWTWCCVRGVAVLRCLCRVLVLPQRRVCLVPLLLLLDTQ